MRKRLAIFGAVALFATAAQALPPDHRVVVKPGAPQFIKPEFVLTGVVVEPEAFAKAEILPTHEILVTPSVDANGSGIVLVFGSSRVSAWEMCVGACPAETSLSTAKSACSTLTEAKQDGQHVWTVSVSDSPCLAALRQALAHATVPASELRIGFSESVALDFFHQVLTAIAGDPRTKGIKAGYLGPTLTLSGEATVAALGRTLVHAWQGTVGSVSYDDDNLKLTDAPSGMEITK